MLVLSRKQQETIRIGDQITITIVKLHGNRVRLGIDAPKNIEVLRGEIAFEMPEQSQLNSRSEMNSADKTGQRPTPQPIATGYLTNLSDLDTAGLDTAFNVV